MIPDEPIVLTGAASGIGNATARRLLDRGRTVISLDIQTPTAAVHTHHHCDLSDPASIDAVVAQIDGPIASLMNVAGVPGTVGPELTMRVNTFGLRHLTEALWDRIADGGTVVNVASIAGNNWRRRRDLIQDLLNTPDFATAQVWWDEHGDSVGTDAYTFSKEAVVVYTMQLAGKGLSRGIRANDVGPGPVDTPILPNFAEQTGAELMQHMIDQIGRPARPEDIAEALVVLAGAEMGWVNGQHIVVDGGLTAGFSAGWARPRP
jgi:NAD(P)-dependent dehydrogenase (short-subunit alcohol dehydrogenase family)